MASPFPLWMSFSEMRGCLPGYKAIVLSNVPEQKHVHF